MSNVKPIHKPKFIGFLQITTYLAWKLSTQVLVGNIFLTIIYILRRKHKAYMKVNWRSSCQLRSTMLLPCRKVMLGAANFIIMFYDFLYILRPRWLETFIFICWKTSYFRSWRKN